MKALKDNLAVIGFIVMTSIVVVMYYILGRREKRIGELLYEVQAQKLEAKLKTAAQEVQQNGEYSAEALARYHQLIERYSDTAKRLGVRVPDLSSRKPKRSKRAS